MVLPPSAPIRHASHVAGASSAPKTASRTAAGGTGRSTSSTMGGLGKPTPGTVPQQRVVADAARRAQAPAEELDRDNGLGLRLLGEESVVVLDDRVRDESFLEAVTDQVALMPGICDRASHTWDLDVCRFKEEIDDFPDRDVAVDDPTVENVVLRVRDATVPESLEQHVPDLPVVRLRAGR